VGSGSGDCELVIDKQETNAVVGAKIAFTLIPPRHMAVRFFRLEFVCTTSSCVPVLRCHGRRPPRRNQPKTRPYIEATSGYKVSIEACEKIDTPKSGSGTSLTNTLAAVQSALPQCQKKMNSQNWLNCFPKAQRWRTLTLGRKRKTILLWPKKR
jgi:hypothetical protein